VIIAVENTQFSEKIEGDGAADALSYVIRKVLRMNLLK
jgi:hypothetical protein